MKTMYDYIKSSVKKMTADWNEFFSSLDSCTLALHEGKALDVFEEVVSEICTQEGIRCLSLNPEPKTADCAVMNITIMTSRVPSQTAQYQLKRTIDTINERFSTQLMACIQCAGSNDIVQLRAIKKNIQPLRVGYQVAV